MIRREVTEFDRWRYGGIISPRLLGYLMAKRYKRKGMKKIEPAVDTLYIRIPTVASGAQTNFYCDLSQISSLVNRRFYRQGINWAVGSMKFFSDGPTSFAVQKLPNTWVMFQAYKKAFEAWNRQQMEAIAESGAESAIAAFRDFKVYADVDHVTAGFGANLLPHDFQSPVPQPYAVGEWQPSQIVIPHGTGVGGSTVERELHMVGSNFNGSASRGVIEGYADSRAYPQSPDPVSPALDNNSNWMSKMFDDGETYSDVLDNATDRNDNLPYPQVDYPGGETQSPSMQLHALATSTGTTVGGMTTVKGGTFPCGLIKLSIQNNDSIARGYVLTIDLVPGTHRGYMCESMLE